MIEDFKSITIEGTQHSLENLPMAALMDLTLDDLRDLDTKVGQFDQVKKQTRWQGQLSWNKFFHFLFGVQFCNCKLRLWVSDLFSCQIIKSRCMLLVLVARLVLTHDNMTPQIILNTNMSNTSFPFRLQTSSPHSTLDHLTAFACPSGQFLFGANYRYFMVKRNEEHSKSADLALRLVK